MPNLYIRAVILSALAIGIAVGASSPASANHNSGFDKGEYQVAEAAGYVELTIGSDPCCPPGSGQFDYYTANLSALAGSDYEQTSGTVTTAFCGCSIRVPITNDELFEGEEQFEVRLTNFRGTFNPENPERRRAVVTILDDETPPSSSSATGNSFGSSSASSPAGSLRSGSVQQRAAQPQGAVSTEGSSTSEKDDLSQPAETPIAEGPPVAVRGTEAELQHAYPAVLTATAFSVVAGAALWILWRRGLFRSLRECATRRRFTERR